MKKEPSDVEPTESTDEVDDAMDSEDGDPSEMMLDVEEDTEPVDDAPEDDPVADLTRALDEMRDQWLRSRAEFDNYRKRVARDAERLRLTAAENVLKDLLPVADNFERALHHGEADAGTLLEGIKMVHKQFVDVLARHGVEAIPATGRPFDPNVHDALSRMPSDEHSVDTVALEYEKGYRLGDTVLRPAKVVVSSGPADETEES